MKQVFILCLIVAVAFGSALHKKSGLKAPVGTCTQDGQYLADDYECGTFYHCDEDLEPVEMHCDTGLCWFEATRECVFPSADTCNCL